MRLGAGGWFGGVAGGELAQVLVFLVVHVQGAGERVEDRGAGAGLLAAFQAHVVVDADAGEGGQLLAAQTGSAADAGADGEADAFGAGLGAAGAQVAAQLGALAVRALGCHASSLTRGAPAVGVAGRPCHYPRTARPACAGRKARGWKHDGQCPPRATGTPKPWRRCSNADHPTARHNPYLEYPHGGLGLVKEPVDRGNRVVAVLSQLRRGSAGLVPGPQGQRELVPLGGPCCGAHRQRLLRGAHGAAGLDQQAPGSTPRLSGACREFSEGCAVVLVEGAQVGCESLAGLWVLAQPAGLPRGAHDGSGFV